MVYIQVTFSQNAHLTRRPAAHRSLPPQQLDPKDPKGLLAGTKMHRVLLTTMLTQVGAQKILAPHLGIGTCLIENVTCVSHITCIEDDGEWSCMGVPEFHSVVIAGDTITLHIDGKHTLILSVMFITWCALEVLWLE